MALTVGLEPASPGPLTIRRLRRKAGFGGKLGLFVDPIGFMALAVTLLLVATTAAAEAEAEAAAAALRTGGFLLTALAPLDAELTLTTFR